MDSRPWVEIDLNKAILVTKIEFEFEHSTRFRDLLLIGSTVPIKKDSRDPLKSAVNPVTCHQFCSAGFYGGVIATFASTLPVRYIFITVAQATRPRAIEIRSISILGFPSADTATPSPSPLYPSGNQPLP